MELLEPRSRRELALDIPVDGEKTMGEERPERGRAVEETGEGVKRLALPLGSPAVPRGIRGRVMPVDTSGGTDDRLALTDMGVRMDMTGIVGMIGMVGIPRDRFGIEPIPKRADDVIMQAGLEMGGCFMMIGRVGGRLRPCSFNLMSFMAMENSCLSIFPSLSMSARDQISARTEAGRPD